MKVRISKRSRELINSYLDGSKLQTHPIHEDFYVELDLLLSWLNKELSASLDYSQKSKEEIEFILASLHVELLQNLISVMPSHRVNNKNDENNGSTSNNIKFILLASAGTLLAACEGFDAVTTWMGITSIPSIIILLVGLTFSLLSVFVFYGFNLMQVSKNLGMNIRETPKLLDVYLLQMKEIKAIRKRISTYNLAELSIEDLEQIKRIIEMLEHRFTVLTTASEQFELALQSTFMKIAKSFFTAAAGLLFFGSGFFAGQSVGNYIASLCFTTVTPAFWPVVLFSVLVGIAAFSLYWYVERVGITKLISGWFGLDEEKIELLCDKRKLTNESFKLANIKEHVISTALLANQIPEFEARQKLGLEVSHSRHGKNRFFYSSIDRMVPAEDQDDAAILGCSLW